MVIQKYFFQFLLVDDISGSKFGWFSNTQVFFCKMIKLQSAIENTAESIA